MGEKPIRVVVAFVVLSLAFSACSSLGEADQTTTTSSEPISTPDEAPMTPATPSQPEWTSDPEDRPWTMPEFVPPPSPHEVVRPGDDVGGLVAGSPTGTVFLFKAGRYEGVSVRPKDGMEFLAEPGVVLDGAGEVFHAFEPHGEGVTVRGFVVESYVSEFQQCAIKGATGWTIEGNEVRNNKSCGVSAAGGSTIRDNFVHTNGQIGVKGTGVGLVVEGNKIAHNNTAGHSWTTATAEAGGTKFWRTTGLVVRNNHVHDNDGPGLWVDGFNRDVLIDGNQVETNDGPGIFYEISYAGVVSDNKVHRNQYVGIWISASSDVEVKNNEVVDNLNGGIAASQDDRGDGFYVENLWVHHNYVQMATPTDDFWGWNGLQQQVGDNTYFTTRNNRWDHNTYRIPTELDHPFKWINGRNTIEQWNDHGQDTNAAFK